MTTMFEHPEYKQYKDYLDYLLCKYPGRTWRYYINKYLGTSLLPFTLEEQQKLNALQNAWEAKLGI